MFLALHVTILLLTFVKLASNVNLIVTILPEGQSSKKFYKTNFVPYLPEYISDDPASLSSILKKIPLKNTGQVVGTASHFWLDGLGIKPRWEARFSKPFHKNPGSTQPLVQCVLGLFLRVKRSTHGINHPPPSSVEVKERVKLYLYSPSGSNGLKG